MVIQDLRKVSKIKFQIKILEDKITIYRSRIGAKSILLKKFPITDGTYKNLLEFYTEKILELEKEVEILQSEVNKVFDEIKKLPELEFKVIYFRYFENLNWFLVSQKSNTSKSTALRINDDLFKTTK
jgi:DNA-directed RNA polymerase specialized sigma subunit